MYHTFLTLSFTSFVIAHNKLISPCPRSFVYEAGHKEPDRWYGILTMLSDFDTYGVYVHISLNKPALQFGNWYSPIIYTENNQEFILVNSKDGLKANVPKSVRFFVKYNTSEPPPVIEWIVTNSKKVCPDTEITKTTTRVLESIPSVQLDFKPKPSPVEATSNKAVGRLIGEAPASYRREGIYKGDLNLLTTLLKSGTSPVGTTSNKSVEAGGLIGEAPASSEAVESYKNDLSLLTTLLKSETSPVETTSNKSSGAGGLIGKAPVSSEAVESYKNDLSLLTTLLKSETSPVETTTRKNSAGAGGLIAEVPTASKNKEFYKDDLNLLTSLLSRKQKLNVLSPLLQNETFVGPLPVETTSNKPPGGLIGQPPTSSEDEDFFMGDFHEAFATLFEKETGDPTVNDICGTVVIPPAPLITYGQPTNEGEFPWHVAIYHSRGINLTYICGASLVSQNFVITVAHCVAIPRSSVSLNTETLNVYLGKHYLMHNSNPGIQSRRISEIIIHPDYNAQMYSDDIALLKLSLPAEYTDYVRPICLWQDSPNLNSIVDKRGTVVGWGYDENGIVADRLMQTEMPVVSQEACLLSNPEFYSRYTSESTLCAGFRNGTTICLGDSGGGMIFPKSNGSPKNPVWQLRGLISISPAAHNKYKCDASHYAVFADVAKYLDWIKYEIE